MKLPVRQYIGIIITIILFTCIIAVCSCTSTKHIDTFKETTEETKSINTDSLVKTKVDSVRRKYEELLRTLDADIIFNNDCDTLYRDTGSVRVMNLIKYIPGKGIEASGNIKSFKLRESELVKQLDELTIQLQTEANLRRDVEEALKVELATKKIDKKTKVFNLWWLLFVGYVLGWQFPPTKLITKVKTLFTKI